MSMSNPTRTISRSTLILLLNAALENGNFRFARQSATLWLKVYPGDMEIELFLSKAWIGENNLGQAKAILDRITMRDPECLEAHELLAFVTRSERTAQYANAVGCAYALGKTYSPQVTISGWSKGLKTAIHLLEENQADEAETEIHKVIGLKSDLPLAGVIHLHTNARQHDDVTISQLATLYHARWPECLTFTLYLAESKMKLGEQAEAVSLMHECVRQDATGMIAIRMWGEQHRYLPIWPEKFEIEYDLPIPAAVSAVLGSNILPAGEYSTTAADIESEPVETQSTVAGYPEITISGFPEEETEKADSNAAETESKPQAENGLSMVEKAFAKLARKLNQPVGGSSDGKYPVYVIFSSKTSLADKYGRQTAAVIDKEMRRLADLAIKDPDWSSMVFYPDEANSTASLGLTAIDSIDPWKLKLALVDLEKMLAKKGERIGALLIVGGPDVVPFHKLPNPTDDGDEHVLSDNPYATIDNNYFVPQWPVGRLPGDAGKDAGLLLEQLRNLQKIHETRQAAQTQPWWMQIINVFRSEWLASSISSLKKLKGIQSIGYSTAIWQDASISAFKPISNGKGMLFSPPEFSGSFKPEMVSTPVFGYYNLHGMPDSSDWYGQRSMDDTTCEVDYPVALSPTDIAKFNQVPEIIFSEACYGAYIEGKAENDSVALKFLGIETPVVVGSTCISYGSVSEPLIGADLLANLFWKKVKEGLPVGEALMLARLEMVKEMEKRQGFLDGEDQKTVLSFVLYGDPLFVSGQKQAHTKSINRVKSPKMFKTLCDGEDISNDTRQVSQEVLLEVRQMVEEYLPGVDHTRVVIHKQQLYQEEVSMNSKGMSKKRLEGGSGQVVVTISKEVEIAQQMHRHYARARLDRNGKMLKLTLSH